MKQLTEKFRNKVFWALDALQGGKVKAHYKDIERILENFHTPESKERRDGLLKKLLNHASETTEFYGKYKNHRNLEDFPVVDKVVIRDSFDSFQSTEYKEQPKQEVSTSGSSGTPFKVYQNRDKVLRNRADTLFFQKIAGYEIGYRLYYIRKWLSKYRMDKVTSRIRNIEMVNVADFSDTYLENLVETLEKDTSTKVILSYSSALREICQYLGHINAKPVETKISSIIAMAEGLGEDTREKLKHYFNTPVYLRYSNQENGILSLQLSQSNNNLQINWASYYIEILHPEKDIPVADGELGRVVVTDLFNYCTPFIRYDTGDFAIITEDGGFFKGSRVFLRVEGRKMDILFDTKGKETSGFNIHHLESHPDIKQFQFIQEDQAKYRLKLAVRKRLENEKEVIDRFKGFLGMDAKIEIAYVDEIPQLGSGKRRIIVNRYRKETTDRTTLSQL